MPEFLTSVCVLKCSFGTAPVPFQSLTLPGKPLFMQAFDGASMLDTAPVVNIPTFAMCSSLAKPQVIAATAAAQGVLTPMPCVPVIPAPWVPSSPIASWNGVRLATVQSKCLCTWGGEISVVAPVAIFATESV
jgi:hypothetical protein